MNTTIALLLLITALPAGAVIGEARAGSFQNLSEDREMMTFVKEVLDRIDLHNNIAVVIQPHAPGCAYATLNSEGRQYIAVDPDCVGPLRSYGAYNWRAAGILCHEIAHLIGGDVMDRSHGPQGEAEADEWAGAQLYHMGATLEEAQTYGHSAQVNASESHPGRVARLAAIARGWNHTKGVSQLAPGAPVPQRLGWWGALMATPLPWSAR